MTSLSIKQPMTSKNCIGFNKILNNLDVLNKIFELLDFGDQLRFANISPQLQFIFRNFLWTANYKKLQIKKYSDAIRLKGSTHHMDIELTLEEFAYFLNIYGQDVRELNESHGSALDITFQLEYLTSIKYNYLLLTKDHLQLLAVNCPRLEKLMIYGCCNKNREIIRLGLDIDINTLAQMKMLKMFTLKTGLNYKIKSRYIEDFKKNSSKQPTTIEKLDIYATLLPTNFWFLFENLINLTVTVSHPLTNEVIVAMASCCKHLKKLIFLYISFENIEENFSLFSNLSDLSFYNCEGLTYENLKEILTELKLITFTSIATKYTGLFHYYFISPTIKSILIDAIKSFDFKSESEFYKSKNVVVEK